MDATLGQGYKFGRPEPLTDQRSVTWSLPPMKQPIQPDTNSPFAFVAKHVSVRTARKPTLNSFSRHIEAQARHAVDPPIVLASLQRAVNFTESTKKRYRELAASSPLVTIYGRGLPSDLAPGIRGVDLDPADPLCAQWIVLVLGPHHAAALIARERDTSGSVPEDDRRFDFTITHDRILVTVIARNLLDRIH
jgi:DICT domain-containing protein